MATVENEIIFYHNNNIVFRGNVVLDKFNEGIQNEKFGWISSEKLNMSIIIKDFELKLLPFVSIQLLEKETWSEMAFALAGV